MQIEVLNFEHLDKLIESVSNPENEWGMDNYKACFCGHSNKIRSKNNGAIHDVFGNSDSLELDELILPRNWMEKDNPRYNRENAIRVLKSIKDTGKFEW